MKWLGKFKGKAVHCKTQEEWDYVIQFDTEDLALRPFQFNTYPEIVILSSFTFSSLEFAKQSYNVDIISFEEFKAIVECAVVSNPPIIGGIVGDINSSAKGSGARYNAGKPDYSMLVISDLVDYFKINGEYDEDTVERSVLNCLSDLGGFQKTHAPIHLYHAMSNLGLEAIEESAHVFTYGASKYASWNWTKGMKWSIPLACIVRHALKVINGEIYDDESHRKHTGHIICNIFMLLHFVKHYKEGNDLPSIKMFESE